MSTQEYEPLPCEDCICFAVCIHKSTIRCEILRTISEDIFSDGDAIHWEFIQETLPHCVAVPSG